MREGASSEKVHATNVLPYLPFRFDGSQGRRPIQRPLGRFFYVRRFNSRIGCLYLPDSTERRSVLARGMYTAVTVHVCVHSRDQGNDRPRLGRRPGWDYRLPDADDLQKQ